MADANLFVIYSPLGEKFEVTQPNYRDLKTHLGWTDTPPHPDTVKAYVAKRAAAGDPVEVPASVSTPTVAPEPAPPPPAPETPAPFVDETPEAVDEEGEEEGEDDEAPKLLTTAADFADMEREDVRAYIENVLQIDVDGRKGRDALVAIAIEEAAKRAAA